MAEKRRPDDPTYRWLYPGDDTPDEAPSEATQQFPPPGSPAGRGANAEAEDDNDRTRVMSSSDRPTSFGGTYSQPPPPPVPGTEPGFATPVPSGPQQAPPNRPATPDRRPPPPRRPRRRKNWWLRGVVALVLAWIVFLVAVPMWAYSRISKVDAEPGGDRPGDTPGTTYLLVGSDSRAGLTQAQRGDLATGDAAGQRTDTILLLHVPDGDGPNLLLSIPRDSYVDIPDHGKNKINAAYAFGGAELLVETVEQNTGLRVDDYVEVGFSGFVDVVDSVGGIEVCPKTKIEDPKAGHLKMDPGCQDVDGPTALQYSRSRAFGNGDITRALHQREVISAVGKKAASWQTVVLPWRYFKVNNAAAESLQVGEDVGPIDLAVFGWAMAHSSGADAKRCVVPFSSLGAPTPAGSAVLWDVQRAEAVFEAIKNDDTSSIECAANQ